MGQTEFQVFVEDRRVVAGQTLHGAVYLDASKQISGSSVTVRLIGEERTVVQYEQGDWSRNKRIPKSFKPIIKGVQSLTKCMGDNNYRGYTSKNASVRILSVEVPVGSDAMIAAKKVEPGKYKLPFDIDLPHSLPSAMHLNQEEGVCEIVYTMEAQIKGSGWFSDFKASCDVFIQSRPLTDEENQAMMVVPFEGPPEIMPITLLKCRQMGDMTYACRMENTVLSCGSTAQVTVACHNDSTLGVSSVVAELVQDICWEAGGMESKFERTIASQTFPQWSDLQPITPEQLQERKSLSRDAAANNRKSEILESLQSNTHHVSLRVPPNAAPSYEGQLLRITHILRLRFVSSYYLDAVAPCPKVEIPVQILATIRDTALLSDINLPAWASDIASLIITAAVCVPSQDFAYGDFVAEEDENETPSVSLLLETMKKASNDIGVVFQKSQQEKWKPILSQITPQEYGSIVGQVQMEFHKPQVAIVLASIHSQFLCAHVVEGAVKTCLDWMRASLITQLLPHCTDLKENQHVIVQHLSDWEELVLHDALTSSDGSGNNNNNNL